MPMKVRKAKENKKHHQQLIRNWALTDALFSDKCQSVKEMGTKYFV